MKHHDQHPGPDAHHEHGSGLRDYLGILRRRVWVLAVCALLTPALVVAYALHQPHRYRAASQVLLNTQSLGASVSGIAQNQALLPSPERNAQTQAELALTPAVASKVLQALGLERTRTSAQLLAETTVSAEQNAELLDIAVTDGDRSLAIALANEYSTQYTVYRRALDTQAVRAARAGLARQIAEVRGGAAVRPRGRGSRRSARSARSSPAREERSGLLASLIAKDQQLQTLEALQTAGASVARSASDASQVQPKPIQDGLLGLALGIVLGVALAFARESLDLRVRSGEAVAERLGVPVIGRIAAPPRELRETKDLVMLSDPTGLQAEAFRLLRINLEFMNLRGARTMMVTSATQGEGKSTTAANLALALACSGQNVVLVDLDLRRPDIHRLFHLGTRPGITDVARGSVQLEEALAPIALPRPMGSGSNGHGPSSNGFGQNGFGQHGRLQVLGVGTVPPNPSDFVASEGVARTLEQLSEVADLVLVDTPPLLGIGDALQLSARIDAMVLVCQLKRIKRPTLSELRRVVESSRAEALGLILTGAEVDEGYDYYGGYYYRDSYHEPDGERPQFVETTGVE